MPTYTPYAYRAERGCWGHLETGLYQCGETQPAKPEAHQLSCIRSILCHGLVVTEKSGCGPHQFYRTMETLQVGPEYLLLFLFLGIFGKRLSKRLSE